MVKNLKLNPYFPILYSCKTSAADRARLAPFKKGNVSAVFLGTVFHGRILNTFLWQKRLLDLNRLHNISVFLERGK